MFRLIRITRIVDVAEPDIAFDEGHVRLELRISSISRIASPGASGATLDGSLRHIRKLGVINCVVVDIAGRN
jgi:hypothetical protein